MEEDITKKPLVEIITEMTRLEQEIGLKQIKNEKELALMELRYERLRLEVVRRFPIVEQKEEFKPIQKSIKKPDLRQK